MPSPKTVSADIATLLNAVDKTAARSALLAETAGAAAVAQAASQPLDADLTAYALNPTSAITTALGYTPATAAQGAKADLHSSPLLSNEARLLPFWKQLAPFQTSVDPLANYIVIAGFLDSIGTTNGPTRHIGEELYSRFGVGALMSTTLGATSDYQATALVPAYAGGAAVEPAAPAGTDGNWAYLPNGKIFNIPSGGSVTETPASPFRRNGFQNLRVFYGIRSGGGTLTVTVTQNGVALASKNANTGTGTAGGIGYIEFTSADGLTSYGAPSIASAASVARVDGLGCLVYLRSGAIVLNMGRGNSSSTNMSTVPAANFTYLQNVFGLSLAIHASKGETNAEIDLWYDKVAANMPKVSHLVLGNSPSNDDAEDLQSRERQRLKALEKKFVFFDAGEFFRSHAELLTLGWQGDSVHLSPETWRLQAGWLTNRILNLNFSGADGFRSVMNPATQRDLYDVPYLQNTTRRASFDSLFGTSIGTGWTQTLSRGRNQIAWTTTASTSGTDYSAVDLLLDHALYGYNDSFYRWQMIENFGTCETMTVKIACGTDGFPQFTRNKTGYDWEFGFETISSVLTPWVRFEVHDGTTRYQSPKFYLPLATNGEGYIKGGAIWHNWAMKVDGSGTSSPKRFRCWVAPASVASTSAKTGKPILVADWTVTLGTPNWFPSASTAACSWGVLSRGTPASAGNIKLLGFETDNNFRDPAALQMGW